jgi:outer membrane receptor protein involved in Fe transport
MKSILFAAAAAGALSFAVSARADDAPAAAASLDELVVTARAGSQAQSKVQASYAITTVSEEKLRLQSPPSVAEVLKNVPGFWVEASGGVGGANIRARGIPIEGYAAVGLQEDGLPVQHDGGLGFLNPDFAFRLDETTQRVEVVRGGPSSIFASYAPAGVVNFITRRGSDHFEGLVKAEVGDYGEYRGDFWVGGPLGGGFRGAIGGFYRQDDGQRDPGWTADKGGQIRATIGRDFEHGSIDFDVKHIKDNTIFYVPVPLTNDADGNPAALPGFDPLYGTLAGPETAHLTFRTNKGPFNFDQTKGSDLDLTQYTLRGSYEFDGWRLSEGLRYHDTTFSRAGLFPNTPISAQARINQDVARGAALGVVSGRLTYVNGGQPFDVANQNGNGLVMDAFLRQQDITLKELISDTRVQRSFEIAGQAHDVAFGFYYADVDETFLQQGAAVLIDIQDNARLLNLQGLNAAGQVVADFTENGFSRYGTQFNNASGHSKSYALYAADEWHLTDKLRIDLGGRWERIDMSGRNEESATQNLNQTPSLADDSAISGTGVFDALDRSFDGFAWTVAANYQFQPNVGAFARYTRAFRLPSLGDFITNPTNTSPRTQKFNLAEAGVKIEQSTFSFYATAFYTSFDSQSFTETRFDQPTNSFISTTQFAPSRAYGLELEGLIRPVAWFDTNFNATIQDSTVEDFIFNQTVAKVGGACPLPTDTNVAGGNCLRRFDFSGNQQIRTPKISLRITPGVNLFNDRLRLETELQYYGKRYSDLGNTTAIPAYYLLSASARYNVTDHLTLYAYGTNLTNEIGLTEGNPRAGQFISGEQGAQFYLGRPEFGRTFRFAALYRF